MSNDVDFVILWVDGNDEGHKQKRAQYIVNEKKHCESDAEQSTGDNRFIQHNELRFCLRSIKRYAPWYRRIWLVTDCQVPSFLNAELLEQDRISIVDHKDIFLEKEHLLPTFNTRAIASQIDNIPGLSERFIYGNDDFMLATDTSVSFFFDGHSPRIWGDWTNKGINGKNTLFQQGMINACRLFHKDCEQYIHVSHGFQPFTKSIIASLRSQFSKEFENNLAYRFRHRSQLLIESLVNHYCHYVMNTEVLGTEPMVHFSFELCRAGDSSKIDFLFELLKNGKRTMFCLNEYDSLVSRLPFVDTYLESLCGPKLVSEG
jgi:hypothetical protein